MPLNLLVIDLERAFGTSDASILSSFSIALDRTSAVEESVRDLDLIPKPENVREILFDRRCSAGDGDGVRGDNAGSETRMALSIVILGS